MSSRFPPACASAPAPAALVWETHGVPAWELNAAARDWTATAHWSAAEWASLAQAVLDEATRGAVEGHCPMLRLRWRASPLDGAWLAWLLPLADGDRSEAQALREQVQRLQEHLRVAEDAGRMGLWERDIRQSRAHWDEHMFRFLGFDPGQGVPTQAETVGRLHPDDRARAQAEFFGSMQRAGRYDARYRVLAAHGGVMLAHVVWEVIDGADGAPERLIGVVLDDTESVRAAQQRQEASVQLGLAVGLVGISLWRIDLATQRIQLNDWGYELIGFQPQPDGMLLSEMRESIHPDDRAAVAQAAERALATSGIVDAEARYRRPDGSYRTLLTRRIAQRDEQGRAVALIGISLDITDRTQQTERAQQAMRNMELIAEATGVGVWSVDLESGETVWSGQMWRIFGISPDVPVEQARRLALHLTHPADRDALNGAYELLASGQPAPDEVEFRIRRTDGEPRWVVGRGRSAMNGGRRVLFGIFIDVTEQRATQERLRRAEQRSMLAAKAVGLAIWERDLVTGDTHWDTQMYRLRGLSPEDPRSPRQLRHTSIHPDDLPEVERRTAQIIARESDYTFDFRVVWPDGTVRWLATRGSVVRDADGRALRILGINWDVTEHKRGEDMRREKAAAEEANRAKSEFLSRMSHELRTPLNAVLGFAQLMLGDPEQSLGERQRERTERIRNAGEHLLALIDDVLDLTSLEVATLAPAARPVALVPLVDEMLQWLAPTAQQSGVTLSSSLRAGSVLAEPRRLRQVLSNLLSNAVKYNRPGGRVEIGLIDGQRPAPHGQALGFFVRDTGRGLTSAQLERLFEPFNRLGAERDGIEGTGIGLTIVRTLVQHMGGSVEVQSSAGEGSEFRVWLPRSRTEAAPEPAASDPAGPPPEGAGELHVLYIEDNPVNVLLVRELVALRPQVRLHVATDGRSGIERAHDLRPGVVLIDLQLPDIDGFEVLRALRADPSLAGLVCIALSANAMPDDIARAKQAGFDDYWTKPIDFGQFLGGLDRL
ncbi:partial two-component system, NarL family, sensor histidine kinase EvgS, partial [Burkholderiaceae bacterium]